ncbi:MAG: cell division/cell wall cluster transcriptional repressor MraZ [Alphaproteobacteria bacterium]|nr:cell division/cell wall cluster transcriptional repressor MraZ [Alphaproteobacteria bacterium]
MSVQPFMSTVLGTLDSKGRVCIPAAFRQYLASQNTDGVYICASFFQPVLEGFGQEVVESLHRRLAAHDPFFSPRHDDEAHAVISRTHLLPADEQGRVRLPDAMIEHAGLKDRIAFLGLSQKFQIWDAQRLAAVEEERLSRIRQKFERDRSRDSGEP